MTTPTDSLKIAAWRTLQRIMGEPIVYHLNTTQSIAIELAVLTQPKANRIDTEGIGLAVRQWHWLIDPDDLSFQNERVIPTEGHWIMRGPASNAERYKLTPGEGKNLVWRWSDSSHVWRRIFVEEV